MKGVLVTALAAGVLWSSGGALAFADQTLGRPPAEVPMRETLTAQELARAITRPEGKRPLLLHVGFQVPYRAGHIPGSTYVGASSTPEGLAALRRATSGVRPDREIVLYCGCCPWKDCPNVRPAFAELRRLGFKKVRVLYLPKDFFTDWADKKLPVAKGNN